MKNVMKFLIVAVVCAMATETFSQTLGVKAGMNLSNMLMRDDEDTYSDDFKMNPGFHVGPTAEFPISDVFSFEAALLISTKGFKISETETFMDETMEYKLKCNLLYLEMPLNLKGTFAVGGANIYGTFGPYIGIGLSGKVKFEASYDGETETSEVDAKFGSDENEDTFKTLDYGLTMGAGVEINSIQIGLTYGLGLSNISLYTDGGTQNKNRVFGISCGYKFREKQNICPKLSCRYN